jgi:hypothetical protein
MRAGVLSFVFHIRSLYVMFRFSRIVDTCSTWFVIIPFRFNTSKEVIGNMVIDSNRG